MTLHPLRWLWLGVAALAVAGVFAIILVAARTPQLAVFGDLFSVALVVHVDLSVLLWFLCIGGFGWQALMMKQDLAPRTWRNAGFYTVAASTALIALSPIDRHWEVVKSNYIPVLNNLPFLAGLGLLMAGLVVMLLPLLRVKWRALNEEEILFASAGQVMLLALVAFALSAHRMGAQRGDDLFTYFNTLFWAGGHIMQFAFTLLMMAAWVALADAFGLKKMPRWLVKLAAFIAALAAMKSFGGFFTYPRDAAGGMAHQTRVMIELGGMGAGLLAIALLARLVYAVGIRRENRAYGSTLIASLVLFFAGGVLGLMISGQNVTIPAHYHGAIVGITLALMGYAYVLLPRHGYPSVAGSRLAFWQPVVYGTGQLMHIGGLAYSGGYGVLRKTPAGEMAPINPDVKAALGFMGLGGLLAIIGGLLFVVVMIKAWRSK